MTISELSNLCRLTRIEKQLTQKQLASLVGIKQEQISRFENGKENFCANKLLELFEVLGIKIESPLD